MRKGAEGDGGRNSDSSSSAPNFFGDGMYLNSL